MSRGRTVNHLFNSGEIIGNIVIKQQIRIEINRKTHNGILDIQLNILF